MGVKIKQIGRDILAGLNHLLWPEVCVSCAKSISTRDDHLCPKCWQNLLSSTAGDYCPTCGKDVSKYSLINDKCGDCPDVDYDQICRAGVYDSTLKKMILSFKIYSRTDLDFILGFLGNSALQGCDFFGEIDYFVPVPLHWTRKLKRGFNQSLILARRLEHPKAKVNIDLVRVRKTQAQMTMKSHNKRKKNVAGAFAVRGGHEFSGAKVCLVDDIKTSGATLNECAKVLKQAGAARVYTLVLAVAGQGR